MTNPTSRRLTAALDAAGLEVDANQDRIQITGQTREVDALLDRLVPERTPVDCDGQGRLFDPAPYCVARLVAS